PPLSRESSESGKEKTTSPVPIDDDTTISSFDFTTAYKRLLTKFSVHPAPREKLKALFEMERLMTASFTIATPVEQDNSPNFQERMHFPPTPKNSTESTRKVSKSSAVGTDD